MTLRLIKVLLKELYPGVPYCLIYFSKLELFPESGTFILNNKTNYFLELSHHVGLLNYKVIMHLK